MTSAPAAGTELDLDLLQRLDAFLVAAGEDVRGPLRATLLAGGRSNLTYRVTDGTGDWVLRRPPTGGVTASAHDVLREYRVGSALQLTDVPVARTVAADTTGGLMGVPFTVVAYVPSRTIRSRADLDAYDDAQVSRCTDGLVGALATLHAVDVDAIGLGDFGRRDGYAERQLRRWGGQWEQTGGTDHSADALIGDLEAQLPEQSSVSLVHGDYRIDNVLTAPDDPARVVAIVDWELSTLGDPVADVALMCAYRHPALDAVLGLEAAWASDRLPSPAELREQYESRTRSTLQDWDFHLALAYFKIAAISRGISYRHRLGATAGTGYEQIDEAVTQFIEAGRRTLGRRAVGPGGGR